MFYQSNDEFQIKIMFERNIVWISFAAVKD